MTRDLLLLSDWLSANQVTHVAMESTGVYWKPVWNILEEHYTILLVNAQRSKPSQEGRQHQGLPVDRRLGATWIVARKFHPTYPDP
jgi:hypothetical protein